MSTPEELWASGVQPVFCQQRLDKTWTPQPGTTGKHPFAPPTAPSGPYRLAFRPPLHGLLIDVDDHDGKGTGPATFAAMEAEYGPLPPTHRLTSRGFDQPTGRYLYRIPDDLIVQNAPFEAYGGAVDSIRTGHRFSWAPGDVNPKTGTPVVCWSPDGAAGDLPHVDTWPELPATWVDYLRQFRQTTSSGEGGDGAVESVRLVTPEFARAEAERRWREYWDAPGNAGQDARGKLLVAARTQTQCDQVTGEQHDVETFARAHPDYAGGELGKSAQKALSDGVAYAERHRWQADWMAAMAAENLGNGQQTGQERPPLDVTNTAVVADWLRQEVGAGPLSGMFARGEWIVHTPQVGEDGYVALTKKAADDDGPAQVRRATADVLAARIQYSYTCMKFDGRSKQWRPGMFPTEAARTAVNASDMLPNLRRLRGITHTPTVRVDGSVLDTPGYDEESGMLYLPAPGLAVPAVPEQPTVAEVRAAVALLDQTTAGFPFVTPHDRANYYAALLSPLLRQLAPPPYKLIGIGAPERGSGKSLLAAVNRILHGGVIRSEMPEDDAELRKQISTILDVTTAPVVEFDNVSGVLRSSVLAGLLTAKHWDDRRLGGNTMVSRPNDRLWTITGNNLLLGGDLVRRTLWITIDPGVPNPERRAGFAITDLPTWVTQRRGDLLHALLTLVRAWIAAGRPVGAERGSDGFAGWLRTVDGILSHAEVPGTVDHPDAAQQTLGADDDEWGDFLTAVYDVFGTESWTVKELLAKVGSTPFASSSPESPQETQWRANHPIPRDALPGPIDEKISKASGNPAAAARTLGMWLRNRQGRWAQRLCVREASVDRTHMKRWRLEGAGTAGTAGTNPHPYGETVMPFQGEGWGQPPADPAVPAVEPPPHAGRLPPAGQVLLDRLVAGTHQPTQKGTNA